ncbi:MAG: helix-hairpin-helix domain-containing protein [Candidatus Lokiarchaeota archaeon]
MISITRMVKGIGESKVRILKQNGIDSIEKLASSDIERLSKIEGISVQEAKSYVLIAQRYLKNIETKQNIDKIVKDRIPSKKPVLEKPIIKASNKSIKKVPLDSLEKLARSNFEDLSRVKGISINNARRYIEIAQKYLESMRLKEKEENLVVDIPKNDIEAPKVSTGETNVPKVKELPKKAQISDFVSFKPVDHRIKLNSEVISQIKKKTTPPDKIIKKKSSPDKKSKQKVKKKSYKADKLIKHYKGRPFFTEETMQRIRFLHFKIKHLETNIQRNEDFSFSELNYIIEYIKILNVNYKTQSQIKLLKELDISPTFYDPIAKKDIKIWDLIFECARALWISAQAYSYLSRKFEVDSLMENAIVAMVECSKMYKTAAYFSAACTRQEDKGSALSVEILELNSEQSRILAQNLATLNEIKKENYSMAAKLSAGLSALTKRLAFLRTYDQAKHYQLKAQYNYDMGKACHLKATYLLKLPDADENQEMTEALKKKANYYYLIAENLWEFILKKFQNLSEGARRKLKYNLSVVNENIMENDVVEITEEDAIEIQDPEPLIIIPENLAPFIPRTTNFLTKYNEKDLNFDAYLRYKKLMSDVLVNIDKAQELRNTKAGVGRTLKQLQILYDNNDIDVNSFTELFEKYSIKLETIANAIQNLKNPSSFKPSSNHQYKKPTPHIIK